MTFRLYVPGGVLEGFVGYDHIIRWTLDSIVDWLGVVPDPIVIRECDPIRAEMVACTPSLPDVSELVVETWAVLHCLLTYDEIRADLFRAYVRGERGVQPVYGREAIKASIRNPFAKRLDVTVANLHPGTKIYKLDRILNALSHAALDGPMRECGRNYFQLPNFGREFYADESSSPFLVDEFLDDPQAIVDEIYQCIMQSD